MQAVVTQRFFFFFVGLGLSGGWIGRGDTGTRGWRNGTMYIYKIVPCFSGIKFFSLPVAGLFSRSRLRGTQGTRLYATVQVWVPAGLRGA